MNAFHPSGVIVFIVFSCPSVKHWWMTHQVPRRSLQPRRLREGTGRTCRHKAPLSYPVDTVARDCPLRARRDSETGEPYMRSGWGPRTRREPYPSLPAASSLLPLRRATRPGRNRFTRLLECQHPCFDNTISWVTNGLIIVETYTERNSERCRSSLVSYVTSLFCPRQHMLGVSATSLLWDH